MIFVARTLTKEIMATDIYLALSSDVFSREQLNKDLDYCVEMLKDFEKKYSRFIWGNELYELNNSSEKKVSKELFDLLKLASIYYKKTDGIFDISIKNLLEKEGYNQSFMELSQLDPAKNKSRNTLTAKEASSSVYNFSNVLLDEHSLTVKKPLDLHLDLGGIGKGFVVDKVATYLNTKYSDFCVNAGGDLYAKGVDTNNKYSYWAIDIEDPFTNNSAPDMPLLTISNKAVATSGINRRRWLTENGEKNHLIDTRTGTSVSNNLVCVTVIGDNVVDCDVMAKYLLILGLAKGLDYCDNNGVPAVFITKDREVFNSQLALNYVWKEN